MSRPTPGQMGSFVVAALVVAGMALALTQSPSVRSAGHPASGPAARAGAAPLPTGPVIPPPGIGRTGPATAAVASVAPCARAFESTRISIPSAIWSSVATACGGGRDLHVVLRRLNASIARLVERGATMPGVDAADRRRLEELESTA